MERGTRMGLSQQPRKYASALCTGWIQTLPSTQLEHELHFFLPFMLESSAIDSSPVWLFEPMLVHITNVEGGGGSPSCTSEAALGGLIGCSTGKAWGIMQCPVPTRQSHLFLIHPLDLTEHLLPGPLGIRDAAVNKTEQKVSALTELAL